MRISSKIYSPVIAVLALLTTPVSFAQGGVFVNFSIHTPPPPLPVYAQPPCPQDGYLWTPGYWAWGSGGYYWVPGVWVRPPEVGVLWTPGYWAFAGAVYTWHPGYWGPHVGFYGGVHYGFGYTGAGFVGGVWHGGVFRYNTAVVNVNRTIVHNTYVDRTVIHNTTAVNRASFNGTGGIVARPTAVEASAMREQHFQATTGQILHQQIASHDFNQRASVNHGYPPAAGVRSINARSYNQQQRITEGFRGGEMSGSQAARADNREQNINRSAAAEREANGGKLTGEERQNLRQRQNRLSQEVHDDKHN